MDDARDPDYAPLLVLIGHGDTVTPARFCEQMKRGQPPATHDLELVLYPRAPHTFDMRLPDRTVLGMRLGHDPSAHAPLLCRQCRYDRLSWTLDGMQRIDFTINFDQGAGPCSRCIGYERTETGRRHGQRARRRP
jgi:hypothetical protein